MRFSLNGFIADNDTVEVYRWVGLEAVCPADLRNALANNPAGEEFVVEINSFGGAVFAGFEMYSLLKEAAFPTRAEVQSIAASAASVVLAGADIATATPAGMVMIHLPAITTDGNRFAHKESIRVLDSVTDSILDAYVSKVKGKTERTELRRMMDSSTWLSAASALEIGLLDEIQGDFVNAAVPTIDIAKIQAKMQAEKKHARRSRAVAYAEAQRLNQEGFTWI